MKPEGSGLRGSIARLRAIVQKREHRPFFWACAFFLAFGAIDAGAPIDDGMRLLRNGLRDRPASQDIAIIFPDSANHSGVASWGWTREELGGLVRNLQWAGANNVAIAKVIVGMRPAGRDDQLAVSLKLMPERSIIATSFDIDGQTNLRRPVKSPPDLARISRPAVINHYFNAFGSVTAVPYRVETGAGAIRSMASELAGRDGLVGQMAPIDYSIDLDSIPVIGIDAALQNRLGNSVRGKTVVVASYDSLMNVKGKGRVPAAYAHILGAETLKSGRPKDIGWFPPFALALLLGAVLWFGSRRTALVALSLGMFSFSVLPLALELQLIFPQTSAALFLIASIAAIRSYRSYRRAGTRENILTGLPNLAALKERRVNAGEAIVVGKIANYAELVSVVTVNERLLAEQIVARLSGGAPLHLYHGDGGIFAWVVAAAEVDSLGDHLDALHAFFLKPVSVSGWQVDVTIAFGVNVAGAKDMATCFACALVAADEAVEHQHRWKFYDASRLGEAEWNVSLLGKLDTAILSGEVWVAYQPKIDVRTRSVTGFEALVRWSHPERGAISPEQFVAVAESHGRIDSLTYFVLDDALRMLTSLGVKGRKLGVAVNLSVRMFERRDFIEKVRATLDRYGVEPSRLTLEITESAAAESETQMLHCIASLVKLGIRVSIDDYGTGYSTLEYLKKVRAAELKIDRGFVVGMERNRSDFMLVKATIDLAHSLGHAVVAEGVETETTLKMLEDLGCDTAQGYLIARPMPRQELATYLKNNPAKLAA